ncbi:MAG: DPP IV N-terminal domain-containing protein [Cephaloticoccus sp.]|nr:DPP IV N-terminal domain-containing protein [Cephaloticoccus sp.]MCF7760685.1 DPP IV N-terminal domain-containing protein [Cephaloticoccus sp.]
MKCVLFLASGLGLSIGLCGNSLSGLDVNLRFFRDLAETRNYSLGQPVSPQITPDNKAVIFLRGGHRNPILRLYELDIASGTECELLTPDQLLDGAAEKITKEEKARRERERVSLRGFTKFDLSRDGARILVTLSGQLYVVDRKSLTPAQAGPMTVQKLPGENWLDPRFSPDGTAVAAVKHGELYTIELASNTARQITRGATPTLTHGLSEFVAQEEMDRPEGYWWSPDSQWLVYQENDESAVEVRYVADPLHPADPPTRFFYPRAGTSNTKVRLGIISRQGGDTRWINWDSDKYPYLARVIWREKAAPLCLLVQDRAQQNQLLLAVDAGTVSTQTLVTESDPAWLNLDSAGTLPVWLADGRHFLWTSESRGTWQIELRDSQGLLERVVTPTEFIYKKLVFADTKRQCIYVLGGHNPVETQLWEFPLTNSSGRQLTGGFGLHHARFSEFGGVMVHSYELLDGTRGCEVLDFSGHKLAEISSLAENPAQWAKVEITKTPGEPSFNASLVRPGNYQTGKKYPVILSVYAGPTTTVVQAGAKSYLTDQWMADQGYIVVRLDGRGTPYHGRNWERSIQGNLIDVALADQVTGLQALASRYPELDLQRVGVMGWSFGGYFTAMAVARRPEIFRCGVAGAPVVTWENYDTHYTERYLGTPQQYPEAYRISSVLTYADGLSRPLLLIHGVTDDNVYFQHTLQLTDALYRAGKSYELIPLPGTHMVNDPIVKLRQQERIMEFFNRNLRDTF